MRTKRVQHSHHRIVGILLVLLLAIQPAARADIFPFFTHHLWNSPDWQRHLAQGLGDVIRDGSAVGAFVVSGGDVAAAAEGYAAGSEIRQQMYHIGGMLHNNTGTPPPSPPPPARMAIPPANTSCLVFHFYWNSIHCVVAQTSPPVPTVQGLSGPNWMTVESNGTRVQLKELDRTAEYVTLRNLATNRVSRITSNGMELDWNGQTFVPTGVHGVMVGMHRVN